MAHFGDSPTLNERKFFSRNPKLVALYNRTEAEHSGE